MQSVVPNKFPETDGPYRIAFIGEAPGEHEVEQGQPFVGKSGALLKGIANSLGISPMCAFFGNVCQHRPPNNDFRRFSWEGPQVQDGLAQLKKDLERYDPNLCVLLGQTALRAAGKGSFKVSEFRGSLFRCSDPSSALFGYKCLSTLHPANLFHAASNMPLFKFDLARARNEGQTAELILPERKFDLDLTPQECLDRLDSLRPGELVALDIEGGVGGISCISFSTSPDHAWIIPFFHFSPEDDARIVIKLREVLGNPEIPKVLQNGLYDAFVLAWEYNVLIRNIAHDTMLSGWELYPELRKGLGTQTSIWTKEPYYKFERKVDDRLTHLEYCCKDSCVTLEIAQKHLTQLKGSSLTHFNFNMQLLPALLYMKLRGMRYDKEKAHQFHEQIKVKIEESNMRLAAMAGEPVNVNSPQKLCKQLYTPVALGGAFGFPPQYKKEGNRYNKSKFTSDAKTILTLARKSKHPFLREIITQRSLHKLRQAVEVTTNADGRIRCNYNLVGTETGRLSCSKSDSGSGTNLQTITKQLRVLYRADPGFEFFQLDLEGADGWTVAAHCARFGDTTMLDDYRAGLKPARIIALMHLEGEGVNQLSREELIQRTAHIGKTDDTEWLYFVCKQVQHGTNYGLGAKTMSDNILVNSNKYLGRPIYVDIPLCRQLQRRYLIRYNAVKSWQTWVDNQIRTTGKLTCASGHTRTFFGSRNDNSTLREALSEEPQSNTSYATNLALLRLWQDPENHTPEGALIIEPLHQVHDALCGQWPEARRDWAISKLRQYFDNELLIGGVPITIPFDGGYGPSWGECKNPI